VPAAAADQARARPARGSEQGARAAGPAGAAL